MIRPIPIFLLVSLIAFTGDVLAQNTVPCKEIKVQSRTESISSAKSKVTLEFASGQNAKDFKLFLFGDNQNRRLNFSATEKIELSKGKYTLIIQSKNDESFCTKQLNLKLE